MKVTPRSALLLAACIGCTGAAASGDEVIAEKEAAAASAGQAGTISPVQRFDPIRPPTVDAMVWEDHWVCDGKRVDAKASCVAEAYAYVDTLKQPGEQVVLGIKGKGGRVGVGSAWHPQSPFLLKDKDGTVDVAFIGLSDAAEIGPVHLGETYVPVENAHFFNLGIRGGKDSFAIRQGGFVGSIVFDTFWILPNEAMSAGNMYSSGFHLHAGWNSLTLKKYQARGLKLREHCFYLKPGGRVQVLECELWGGNRTGVQCRPHQSPPASPKPTGDILFDGNYALSFGWNHDGRDGGGWITVWCSLENTVSIRNNRCTDARYGCLVVSQGVPKSEPYLTRDGYSHSNVWIEHNTFENLRSTRDCVSVTAVRQLHMGPGNSFTSSNRAMVLNSAWAAENTDAKPVKEWLIHGKASFPSWDVHEYAGDIGKYRLLTKRALLDRTVLEPAW